MPVEGTERQEIDHVPGAEPGVLDAALLFVLLQLSGAGRHLVPDLPDDAKEGLARIEGETGRDEAAGQPHVCPETLQPRHRDQVPVAQLVPLAVPEDFQHMAQPLHLPRRSAGVEIAHLLRICRGGETGSNPGEVFEPFGDGHVLSIPAPLAHSHVDRQGTIPLYPGVVEGAGFADSVLANDRPGAIGEKELAGKDAEDPGAESAGLDLQLTRPPEVGVEMAEQGGETPLDRQVLELKVLGLEKEPLVPVKGGWAVMAFGAPPSHHESPGDRDAAECRPVPA